MVFFSLSQLFLFHLTPAGKEEVAARKEKIKPKFTEGQARHYVNHQ